MIVERSHHNTRGNTVKRVATVLAWSLCAALTLTGCSTQKDSSDFLACMISDSQGFDDSGMNQSAYDGLKRAESELKVGIKKAEVHHEAVLGDVVEAMVAQRCDVTITVGQWSPNAFQEYAQQHSEVNYSVVDGGNIQLGNVKNLVFRTSEAAFLAGYVAAAYSTNAKVATFGGEGLSSERIYMDGFAWGVAQYNSDFGASVELLGWNPETQSGWFTGDKDDVEKAAEIANVLMARGADVIMPANSPAGMGAVMAASAWGNVVIVGVETDWFESVGEEYQNIILTSAMKNPGAAVFDVIAEAQAGEFTSTLYIGTLANGGVGISSLRAFESQLSEQVKENLLLLTQQISQGLTIVDSLHNPTVSSPIPSASAPTFEPTTMPVEDPGEDNPED
jgi:basic membrane protein A